MLSNIAISGRKTPGQITKTGLTAEPLLEPTVARKNKISIRRLAELVSLGVKETDEKNSALAAMGAMVFDGKFKRWMLPLVKSSILKTSGKSTESAMIELKFLIYNKKFNRDYADMLNETVMTLGDEKVPDLIGSFNAFLAQNDFKNSEVMFLAFRIKHFKIDSD